ncbi:MAG: GTP cyclohydrolase I [Bizionia sp.]|nr:GTP cyclohydrolase I [Bizionia sp.]
MYKDEIFYGIKPRNMLKIALFDVKYQYNQILAEKNTAFYSNCDYHLVTIMDKAVVSCVSSGKVIGLSKINPIVHYKATISLVQERLTNQIANKLQTILSTEDVAVNIDAKKRCVSSGGIRDGTMATVTSFFEDSLSRPRKFTELQNYLKD